MVERCEHVCGGSDRVSHVVQAVKHRDEVIAVAWVLLGGRDLEAHALIDPCVAGFLARGLDRGRVDHQTVEPQPVADHNQGRAERGAEIADEAADELVELGLIDCLCCGRHRYFSSQTWITV